jgi:SAM-dependent methyltransferase
VSYRADLDEIRGLLADEQLARHPGVLVESGATDIAYRQWASTYDDPGNELLVADLPFVDAILDHQPPGVAVDTACGTGRLARRLAERGHRVLGVDRSPEMVREAARNVPGVRFAIGDLHRLPVADASVDVLTNALALTHVADLRSVFAEWARVLRRGGVAIVSDAHPDLVRLGSVPKAEGADGRPQLAAARPHSVADYLRAALTAGFVVRGFAEPPPSPPEPTAPSPPARELGQWRDWPWSLSACVPAAASVAWNVPSLVLWHFERS